MKKFSFQKLMFRFFLSTLLIIQIKNCEGQKTTDPSPYEIVMDSVGNPLYYKYQAIVSFEPYLINRTTIDNIGLKSAKLSDFVDGRILDLITGSGYFNSDIANMKTNKIFDKMSSTDTISITRLGDTIFNEKPWATLLVFFQLSQERSIIEICDSLNKFFPYVRYAHPNFIMKISTGAIDPKYQNGSQKSLVPFAYPFGNINIEPAWDRATGKSNIKVGVLDMGILATHEDLFNSTSATSVVKGAWNYFTNTANTTPWHGNSHGTLCGGIIAALRNNLNAFGEPVGIAGIAGGDGTVSNEGVSLWDLKVSDDYVGIVPVSVAASAIREGSDYNIDFGFGLHILSNSWNEKMNQPQYTWPEINILEREIRNAFRNKVTFVNSRGNEGTNYRAYPSTFRDEWVLSVGESDYSGNRIDGNFGGGMDLIAPGFGDLTYSTSNVNNSSYETFQGTSAACPHVSGSAALILSYLNSINNNSPLNLAPEDVENLLQNDVTDILPIDYDISTGWGLLNVGKVFDHIDLNLYHVRHFEYSISTQSAIYISTGSLNLTKPFGNFPAGNYSGVKKYKLSGNYPISLPWGSTIEGIWVRNSSSELFDGLNPLIPEPTLTITSHTNNSVTIEGYIYEFVYDLNNNVINKWLPFNSNWHTNIAFTVHSKEVVPTGLNTNMQMPQKTIFPNPAMDIVTVDLGGNVITQIKLIDLSGKLVLTLLIGNDRPKIDISSLMPGAYIMEIINNENVSYFEKLIINK